MTTPPQQRMLSQRAFNAAPSPTLAITAKANALKADGKDVVELRRGRTGLRHAPECQRRRRGRAGAGDTKYTPSSGTVALKDAIVAKLKRDNG